MTPELDLSLLPPQMRLLAQWMGSVEALVILLQVRGGTRIEVPRRMPAQLAGWQASIGREALAGLIAHRPGERIELPMPNKVTSQWRNAAIRAAFAAGESQTALARRHGLTRRQVINICRRMEGAVRQMGMDL
jgi:hypothetical protein